MPSIMQSVLLSKEYNILIVFLQYFFIIIVFFLDKNTIIM